MARLLSLGFELNSLTQGMEKFGNSSQGSIVTSITRNSVYAWRCNPSGAPMSINTKLGAPAATKTVYIRFHFYATTMPPSDALVMLLSANDLTTTIMQLRGTGSGLKVMNSPNTQVGSNIALSTGQWYLIELKVFSHASAGTIDVKVDGSTVVSATGLNTQGSDVNGIQLGSGAASTSDYYIDNLAINDTRDGVQDSWIGDGQIICLRPNAAGDSAMFTRGGTDSGSNWSQCDEVTPNDITDYNVSGTLNDIDMFNCGASGVGSGATINVVHVGFRFANIIPDGVCRIQLRAEKTASGTIVSGSDLVAIGSLTWRTNAVSTAEFAPYDINMYLDPDGSAWTESTLDSMQIGYKITNAGIYGVAVSAVWAMVDYAAGVAAPPPTRSIFIRQAVNRASTY